MIDLIHRNLCLEGIISGRCAIIVGASYKQTTEAVLKDSKSMSPNNPELAETLESQMTDYDEELLLE